MNLIRSFIDQFGLLAYSAAVAGAFFWRGVRVFALHLVGRDNVFDRSAPPEMGAIDNHAMGVAELHFVKCVGRYFDRTTLEVLATDFSIFFSVSSRSSAQKPR
jgi:hypothetical protein